MTNPDKPGIVENWQVGDLAVCVDDSPHRFYGMAELSAGRVYTVADLHHDGAALDLCGLVRPSYCWDASRFRRPDEHEACEEEFVTLLNRTKRTVTA